MARAAEVSRVDAMRAKREQDYEDARRAQKANGGAEKAAKSATTVAVAVPDLAKLEAVIERGVRAYMDAGEALDEIRRRMLYKADHRTFEEYCEARWGFGAGRARQLIGASKAARDVETATIVAPTNEGQARELVKVKPEKRGEVWTKALEASGGKPTAKDVRRAAQPEQPKADPEEDAARAAIADPEPSKHCPTCTCSV